MGYFVTLWIPFDDRYRYRTKKNKIQAYNYLLSNNNRERYQSSFPNYPNRYNTLPHHLLYRICQREILNFSRVPSTNYEPPTKSWCLKNTRMSCHYSLPLSRCPMLCKYLYWAYYNHFPQFYNTFLLLYSRHLSCNPP